MSRPAPGPSLGRSTTFNLASIAVNIASGLALSVVVARAWGTAGFAAYAYLTYVAGTLSLIACAGYPALMLRLVAEHSGRGDLADARRVLSTLTRRALISTAITATCVVVGDRMFGFAALDTGAIAVAVLAVSQTLAAMMSYAAQGARHYDRVLQAALVTTIPASVAAGIAAFGGATVTVLLSLVAIGNVANAAWLFRGLAEELPRDAAATMPDAATIRPYFWLVTGIVLLDLVVWQRSEIFFLRHFAPVDDLSFYHTAFSVSVAAVRMAPAALAGVLTPTFAALYGAGRPEAVARLYPRAVAAMAVSSALLLLLGLTTGRTWLGLYGSAFVPAHALMPWLLLGLAVGNVSGTASTVFHGLGRARRLLEMGIVLAVVNLALDIALIPRYGALGAAVACAVPQFLSLPLSAWLLARDTGIQLPRAALGRVGVALMSGIAMVIAARLLWAPSVAADAAATVLAVAAATLTWLAVAGPHDLKAIARVEDPPPPGDAPPPVTIIVPSKNRADYVRECVTRVLAETGPAREVIVIDSSDDERTQEVLASEFPQVRRVRVRDMPNNRHFAKNQGIRLARGTILCFLDDDSMVEPGWLVRTLAMYEDPAVGAGGGRIVDQVFAQGPVGDVIGRVEPNGRLHLNFTRHPGAAIDIDHAIGCNMSFRACVLQTIGGFDLAYGGPNFMEETDLYLRARHAGYRVRFDPDAVVHHKNAPRDGGLERRALDPRGELWSARSRAYFAWKLLPRTLAVLRFNALGLIKMHAVAAIRERSWPHAAAVGLQAAGILLGTFDWLAAGRPRLALDLWSTQQPSRPTGTSAPRGHGG